MIEKQPVRSAAATPKAGKAKTKDTAGAASAKPAAPKTTARRTAGWTAAAGTRQGGEVQAHIERRAYELWERDGRPEGRDHAHWHQAERELGAAHRAG